MAEVILEKVGKTYPNGVKAVLDANLEVKDKEFLVLLGPSGCGKTTTLRMIAGLEEITEGTIKIGGKVVNDVEPKDRDIAMVFQNYALYPHMSVYENMAFGLKLRKTPKPEIEERVKEAARILGIEQLLDRKPKQLSGGQRQRVAVGRAIVRKPKVFLFDEPLSNLDAKLRVQMRAELKRLHQNLQATIIYVTHDQVEAMTMADKIVIMKDGIIQQIGDPYSVYFEPRNKFVAGFIGTPAMNFISAKLVSENGSVWVVKEDMKLLVPDDKVDKVKGLVGKDITFGIRPEDIYDKMYAVAPKDEYTVKGSVDVVEPLGSETLIHANIHGDDIVAKVDPKSRAAAGNKMDLVFDMSMMHLFDPETEENVLAGTHQDAAPENL
ncbi:MULTISPECIES: sn-glycerol-3-phosphate ABC transporter ATP-binding protein UgpC [Mesotoga]|jgi:multiple sugar transport system ATP-binding protein|uniref:ABC transporter ATP-binding protein n=2 Tax=Kosmotogaceae TaxID=1643948 RepID=UPI0002C9E039|nr:MULTISPECIES: sn-glycerol-3-phosphate ABC transporter ATP-binding protein UgpC [Mesotoga]MCP5456820.1 sn-glycerol-3-phosphate ABC transporter ATP-binding protein UgpC [Thermotogota bacterium]CCU86083.1 Maltodextrin import ATP-binding protein MsmX [Mesotoga infera]MCB1223227.1 sn-glycerol-3-phosphate ABC transporter ATP-binding protein UgpC [Mesotoga sp.]MCP5460997.1 sn-glycerol-3-phosphate ABC transporter ATP-binding protein UgpC [Thermotogota bacterium]MDK2943610.1 multiple sugar transport